MKETINNLTNVLYDRYTLVFMYKGLTFTNLCHHVLHVYLFFILSGNALTLYKWSTHIYIWILEMGVLFIIMEIHRKSLTLCVVTREKKTNKKLWMAYDVQKNDPVISIFQFFVIRIVFCLKIKSSIRNPFD